MPTSLERVAKQEPESASISALNSAVEYLDVNTSTMSMYASALNDEIDHPTYRKPAISKSKLLGMATAKRDLIKKEFHIGEMHDGNIDDLVIRGSNVLNNEITFAKSIPSLERVLVRQETSLFELKQASEELD